MNSVFDGMFNRIGLLAVLLSCFAFSVSAQKLARGTVTEIAFSDTSLPPTLHTMMTGESVIPTMTMRLPDDYDSSRTFPLLVYVPGFDGGRKGNIHNAETITGSIGWVVATLPLFKRAVDKSEVAGGLIVSIEDSWVIGKSYEHMLGRLFTLVPNIDRQKSALVGFSNGAITIAVLLSSHNEFILNHFKNFCMVDHGMFHLVDLHKRTARDCRYLVLVGDKQDPGRELKIRQSQLLQDEMRLLGIDLTCELMKDTGHEFGERQMAIVSRWVKSETSKSTAE